MKKALISTLAPISGGVPQMAVFIADTLLEQGIEPHFAFYQPYSLSPELSVPIYRLAWRNIGKVQGRFRGYPTHAMGAWLPEIEFTHYWPVRCWRELIDRFDLHLSVSGNCLAATAYAVNSIPFWSWVATDWMEDRIQRVDNFPWYRKILDRLVITSGARRMENRILTASGTIAVLSEHTKRKLRCRISKPVRFDVMPMGIDTGKFAITETDSPQTPAIGFVGRLDDPRKNIDLLLHALALCNKKENNVSAVLVGEDGKNTLKKCVFDYGIGDKVTIMDYVDNDRLPEILSSIRVFVVPSHQEGLCIAALEAMSCGVPVISTRCGGPEEFVIDNKTGYLVDSHPELMADAILKITTDSSLRKSMGLKARKLVLARYSIDRVRKIFWESISRTFPGIGTTRYSGQH